MNTTTSRWFSGLFALFFACGALAQDAKRFGIPGFGNLLVGEELVLVFTLLHRDPDPPEKER